MGKDYLQPPMSMIREEVLLSEINYCDSYEFCAMCLWYNFIVPDPSFFCIRMIGKSLQLLHRWDTKGTDEGHLVGPRPLQDSSSHLAFESDKSNVDAMKSMVNTTTPYGGDAEKEWR